MVEGEGRPCYSFITGALYRCYWEMIALNEKRKRVSLENSCLQVSRKECSNCRQEKCLSCGNYVPSTIPYLQNNSKKK